MMQNIMDLRGHALWRYIAVILLGVVLSVVLLGCAVATEPPIAQEVPGVEVVVPITPEVPEEAEADPPEQDVGVVAVNDTENTEDEFVPDWDAITQRADELVEFFTANLVDGITLNDLIKELGREPTFFSFHDHNDMTRVVTTYGFDLMTGPTFTPLNRMPYDGIDPEAEIHNTWFMSGYIGITVRVQILENEDNVHHAQIERGDPDEELRFVIFSFSSVNANVSEFRSYHR